MNISYNLSFCINANGQWCWHVASADGAIIARSRKGFDNKSDCTEDATLNGFDMQRLREETCEAMFY